MFLKRSALRSKQLWHCYAQSNSIRNYHQSIICPRQHLVQIYSKNNVYTSHFVRTCSSSNKRETPEIKTPIQEEVGNIATGSGATTEPRPPEFVPDEHEHIPEPPESGKRLFRDGIVMGLIAMVTAWCWTLYRKKRDNYDDHTLTEIYSVRAHIEHALTANDVDLRTYHLSEAETHCRKALEDLGGGYLSNINPETKEDEQEKIFYDAQIVALHVQLGKICYLLHKYQSAIDNYLIVLKALTQEFGYKSSELIMPCRQISDCYMNLGQNQMSLLFLERALKVINSENSDNHNEYAPICQQMAVLLRKQDKWKESVEYTNKAIKGAKTLLGENHIQIAHMLLGRACCEMELRQWQTAEISARNALRIIESGTNKYSSSAQQYSLDDSNKKRNRIMEGGIKNTLKNKVKNNLLRTGGGKTEEEVRYEQEIQSQQQKQQMIANSTVSGVSSLEQMIEMKCSVLYVIGQSLIEQDRLNEAQLIFSNALRYATDLNDTTKQLLIHDQLRDIQNIITQKMTEK